MEIKLSLNKDVNANANFYFEKAKKLKKKLPGIEEAVANAEKEIAEFDKRKSEHLEKKEKEAKIKGLRKKEWYEKFRFTFTSSGRLFVMGKDATSNEVLIKKHMEEGDFVFHTEAPGSPFGILKGGSSSKDELEEVGQFLACFSKQWKKGFGTADVFYVNPDQVSKKAESGEFIARGAFMIRGEKKFLKNLPLRICLGVQKKKLAEDVEVEELFSGSEKACSKFCKTFIKIEPGDMNYKKMGQEVRKRLRIVPEDLPKYIPNEGRILKK